MGLDGVELIMGVEDRFDVVISDAEAERVRTVGDLTRTVQRKLGIEPRPIACDDDEPCLTAAAFYRLRRAWANHAKITTPRLRPSTRLASLCGGPRGWRARRSLWKLAQRAGVRLPPLTPPSWIGPLGLLLVGIAAFAGLGAALTSGYYTLAWLSVSLAGMLAICMQTHLTRLPREMITVADALRVCPQPRIGGGGSAGLSDLEREVIRMVGVQLGHDPAFITLESRFVEDLDMD